MEKPWAASSSKLISEVKTDIHHGLKSTEARFRLKTIGYNELPLKNGPGAWQLLARQFQSPLILALLIAAGLSWYQAKLTETIFILAVVVANSLIGWFQEYRAQKAMAQLRQVFAPQARVIRDSTEQKIPARLLVPGDILLLEAGDRVGADARIIESQSLRINQASLTGESVPVVKAASMLASQTALIDRTNMAYLSTLVVAGQGVAIVTSTGPASEIGAIAQEVSRLGDNLPPLRQKVDRLGRQLLWASVGLAALVLIVGLFYQIALVPMLEVAVSLLVSLVPEGLPVVLTVILSVALLKAFKHQAIIRRLTAAETLGEATVVAVDKTGTLTEGTMTVERLYVGGQEYTVEGERYRLSGHFSLAGKRLDITKQPAARLMLELSSLATMSTISRADLARDETKSLTDPTETALAVVAAKAGFYAFKQEKTYPELLEVPFNQHSRLSTSIHKFGKVRRAITKGAVESVLQHADRLIGANGQVLRLTSAQKNKLEDTANHYASLGYRIAAIAFTDLAAGQELTDRVPTNLIFVGLFCLTDPIRLDVPTAIQAAKKAGLQVVMITGDHLLTAESIARKVGLLEDGIAIHADDLASADLTQLRVIARSTPKDKLLVIERFQKNGQVVAMTGDGVNDAPALKKADIGIALGKSGTDVAIETADMVLATDQFSSIIFAIEQGRLVFQNLRKAIFYLVSTSLAEAAVIVLALIWQLPIPLLAVQILWLNLVTDGLTSVALAFEAPEPGMQQRPVGGPLLTRADFRRMLLLSLVMTVGTLGLYRWALPNGQAVARTVVITAMVFFQLFNLLNSRSAHRSVFSRQFFTNPTLLLLLLAAVLLQLAIIYSSLGQSYLGLSSLPGHTLLLIALVASSILVVDELRKFATAHLYRWAKQLKTTESDVVV